MHSRKSLPNLQAKPMVLPMQALSILEELITRSEVRLAPLVLQPWIIIWGGSTSHQPRWRREGRWEVRPYLTNVNWFTSKRAKSASCSKMRTNLSLCLSGTQSTPPTPLFLTAHIYRVCVPTVYRWWKNEEHNHKQAIIFDSRHRFCLSSDNKWHSSY